jgi:hypothetical protein
MDYHLREIADCLDEVLRLQSRVLELTEQVAEAAGMNPGDRTLRGKMTGLFFGVQAAATMTTVICDSVLPRRAAPTARL